MTLLMQMTQTTLRYFNFYLPNVCLLSTHSSTDNHHAQRLESTNAFTVSYSNWIQSTWKSRKTIIINSASHIRSDVELGVSVNALSSWYWQKTMSRRLEKRSVTRKISKRYAAEWHKRPNEKCMRNAHSQSKATSIRLCIIHHMPMQSNRRNGKNNSAWCIAMRASLLVPVDTFYLSEKCSPQPNRKQNNTAPHRRRLHLFSIL